MQWNSSLDFLDHFSQQGLFLQIWLQLYFYKEIMRQIVMLIVSINSQTMLQTQI